MFTVIIFMLTGVLLGYLTRKWRMGWLGYTVNALIWVLLFLLGMEVGGNGDLMRSLPTLGLEAGLLATGATLGSAAAAWLLWKRLSAKDERRRATSSASGGNTLQALKGSGIIVSFFILGVCIGLFGSIPQAWLESDISFYALCALMGCVGLSVGHQPKTLRSFRSLDPRLAWLPLLTIIGTWAGSALVSLCLSHRSLTDCLAIGSGFGYYSLSAVFITQYKGAELGTIALVSNIMRELLALLGAPLLARYFGRLAPISAGGATTADTTLPVITKFCGKEFVVVSIVHGVMVDLSVPFLVTFFCSL